MTEILTAAQMRAIEQAAIESGEVTGLELMERAGRGVVAAILEEWPQMALTSQKAVVLCGPGNNGGDGFVVARLLKQRGWEVEVFLYGEVEKLPPDALLNAERWLEMGEVHPIKTGDGPHVERIETADIFIDALFGIGCTRPLPQVFERICRNFRWGSFDRYDKNDNFVGPLPVVAIDIPSGICADSGRVIGSFSFSASLTVTFERAKPGHFFAEGPTKCSALVVAPIGLGDETIDAYLECSWNTRFSRLTRPPRIRQKGLGHKFSHGHALVLSGGAHSTGAARLAARGALRIGAGVVTVGCPQNAISECAHHLTAIMLTPIESADALEETLKDKRINAMCLGPGLGVDEHAARLVETVLRHKNLRVVLDADALTILANRPDLFAALHENCVLTPHFGEFTRLFPDLAGALTGETNAGPAFSSADAAIQAASATGCVVLLKGAATVVACTSTINCYTATNSAHYERSAPWLATAGSGDVLAGFITGLLARGFAPMHAAETAAWLHVECALKFGPGLIAEDLPEQLPAVFRDLAL